ncbi:MAG: amidase family protein, partial [Blautia sp.]
CRIIPCEKRKLYYTLDFDVYILDTKNNYKYTEENEVTKKHKFFIEIIILLFCLAAGGFFYYKISAPPGEEWLSYHNEELLSNIDRQLSGLDIENIVEDKEKYVIEKEITDIQNAIKDGNLTYEELTAICLYRIKTLDQRKHGLNSVLTINSNAMEEARQKDKERKIRTEGTSEIFGIPVLLKDNINTAGIPTSAGAVALADFIPVMDADIVTNLKKRGAVILGKNNLSEFAGYMSSIAPAGYSNAKGQTINPFKPLKISASGSSSGSAVSVTANLSPVSIGTETDGSIVAPASACSVVGFKPTRSTVSSTGILPLIREIDTPGPMAKSVQDVAVVYNAMSGSALNLEWDKDYLNGKTIGLASYEYNDKSQVSILKQALQKAGAKVIEITLSQDGVIIFGNIHLTLNKDYKDFASTYGLPFKTLDDLVAFNNKEKDTNAKYGQDYLEEAAKTENTDSDEINKSIEKATAVLNAAFAENNLDGIAFLNSTASTLPAAAGFPELTIPLGQDKNGVPQGATFTIPAGEDEILLKMGYSLQEYTNGRKNPLVTNKS